MQIMNIEFESDVNDDSCVVRDLTHRVYSACERFFQFVSTFDGTTWKDVDSTVKNDDGSPAPLLDRENRPIIFDSLFTFFDHWLIALRTDLHSDDRIWLDPRAIDANWEQFLRLIPTIYLLICERYDRNPSLLDLVQQDSETGKITRIERRVESKMPREWLNEAIVVPGDPSEEQLEQAAVMDLLTGANHCWPIPHYGKHVPDGKIKLL